MKNKKIKIAVLVSGVLCSAVLVFLLVNMFLGNPISLFLSKNAVEKYIEKAYPLNDYVIDNIEYNAENTRYDVKIVSEGDPSFSFYIYTDGCGRYIEDHLSTYSDENYSSDSDLSVDATEATNQNVRSEKYYIDTLDEVEYKGPFSISSDTDDCNNKFFVSDRWLEASKDRATFTFGITYTNPDSNLTETVAVISADYDEEYENSDSVAVTVEAEIVASNKDCVIFAVYYPPVGDTCSYYYNVNTNDFVELQNDTSRPCGNEWYVFDDMFICTTMTHAVGTEMELYAYNWDGELLYTRNNILSGYTVSDGWVYFSKETMLSDKEKRCTVYKMKLDGTEETEYYTVDFSEYTDFTILDEAIIGWENGERTALDLFTLQPVD